jgi:hypothetical protein
MEVCGQLQAPVALYPERVPETQYKEDWVGPEAAWTLWSREEFLPLLWNEFHTFKASRCSDWDITDPNSIKYNMFKSSWILYGLS